MGGHATHDEREARDTLPDELFKSWGKRDPIGLYEEYLKERGVAPQRLADIEADITAEVERDRKSTRLNSSHSQISYAVFCLKKKKKTDIEHPRTIDQA